MNRYLIAQLRIRSKIISRNRKIARQAVRAETFGYAQESLVEGWTEKYSRDLFRKLFVAISLPRRMLLRFRVQSPHDEAVRPKKISWIVWKPLMVSLSKHERLPHVHSFGEHSKIPLPFDRLRANGILECSTDFYRFNQLASEMPLSSLTVYMKDKGKDRLRSSNAQNK